MRVGSVEAVAWNGDEDVAVALAEFADRAGPWPGLPPGGLQRIRLIVTRSDDRFDSLLQGRVPDWTGAVAIPGANTIILRIGRDPHPTLLHELAHLALHQAVSRVPLWFDEGYAARAAGEWGRLEALELNWALVRGTSPDLTRLNRELRAGRASAEAAYALATTAVLFLERLGGEHGLGPLLAAWTETRDFELALRRTHLLTRAQFERAWREDIRRRYGWMRVVTSITLFWGIVALIVGVVWFRRRRSDRVRKLALDEGWIIPETWEE